MWASLCLYLRTVWLRGSGTGNPLVGERGGGAGGLAKFQPQQPAFLGRPRRNLLLGGALIFNFCTPLYCRKKSYRRGHARVATAPRNPVPAPRLRGKYRRMYEKKLTLSANAYQHGAKHGAWTNVGTERRAVVASGSCRANQLLPLAHEACCRSWCSALRCSCRGVGVCGRLTARCRPAHRRPV